MFEFLQSLDVWLLLRINHEGSHPILDTFFPWITDFNKSDLFLFGFLPVLVLLLFYFKRKQSLEILTVLVVALSINDSICGKVLKPAFERLRPLPAGLDVILRAPVYGKLSFPSNHAANAFCAAFILAWYFPKGRWYFLFIALLISYSRSYVGVHYPSDWMAGAIIGSATALAVLKLRSWLGQKRGELKT